MPETIATAWVLTLIALAAVWLVLVSWLFRHLRKHHTATYEAMGFPSLFWNNSIRNNWRFLKFLFGSKWRALGDPTVAKACRLIRLFLIAYLSLFLIGLLTATFAGTS